MSYRGGSKRNTYKRNYRSKKRYNSKRGPTTKSLAKKVRHIERDLIETKTSQEYNEDYAINTVQFNNTPTDIGQGNGENARIGEDIYSTSLQVNFWASVPLGQQDPTILRVIIVCDRQANGGAPTLFTGSGPDAILDDDVLPLDQILALPNTSTRQRYKFLYDKVFMMHPTMNRTWDNATPPGDNDSIAAVSTAMYKSLYIPFKRKISYTGGQPAPRTNSIYMYAFSNVTNGAEAPVIRCIMRLNYKDA